MQKTKGKFLEDISWAFALFGAAVGAGILFLPIQAGLGGFWALIAASVVIYPIVYPSQRLLARILNNTPSTMDYTGAVRLFLGKKTGSVLSVLFIVFLFALMIAYSIGLNNDIGEFLMEHKYTSNNLARTPYLSLIMLIVFFTILKYGKRFLIKVLGALSIILILLLLAISLLLIEIWDFEHILAFPTYREFFKQFFLILPLMIMSFLFFFAVSPMIENLRSNNDTTNMVQKRYTWILKMTVFLLLAFILLFVFSCIFSLKPKDLEYAHRANISVLALLGDVVNKPFLKNFGPAISFLALTTSFFGVALGLRESGLELLRSLFRNKESKVVRDNSEFIFYTIAIIILWTVTLGNFNIIELFSELIAPLNSIFLFFIPVIIVFKHAHFKQNRNIGNILIFISGIVLIISYYIGEMI